MRFDELEIGQAYRVPSFNDVWLKTGEDTARVLSGRFGDSVIFAGQPVAPAGQIPPDVALETARQAITDLVLALDALKGTDRDAARHGLLGELCDEIADTLPDPDRYEAMKAIEVMAANRRGQIARE
jgi:hypothetical protein